MRKLNNKQGRAGKTFVDKSFPRPFQKTLILSSSIISAFAEMIEEDRKLYGIKLYLCKFFIILIRIPFPQLKFFEGVWRNFFSKKFLQFSDCPQICLTLDGGL